MYILIGRGCQWEKLRECRFDLADLFYKAVSTRGDSAYWKGKVKPEEI